MNKVLLSIIIPFYNVESFISECLDSVFQQNLPEDAYEVICVNDGSTDGSKAIVANYLSNHSNLRLIEHPYNINLGSARNSGFNVAKGKYIWHVDSDDKIAPNCIKEIVEVCDERELDVLEFGYIETNNISVSVGELVCASEVISGQEFIIKYYQSNFGAISPIWKRVYRKVFLDENKIKSPCINMGEDDVYAVHVFSSAERVSYVSKDWYIHRFNPRSLVGENRRLWSAYKWYEASIICAKELDALYRKYKYRMLPIVQHKVVEMIRYNILLCHTYKELVSEETTHDIRKLCRRNFWRDLYVFRYLSRKQALYYIEEIWL